MVGQDPQLRDPSSGDYCVRSARSAIGAGMPLVNVVTDYDGALRIANHQALERLKLRQQVEASKRTSHSLAAEPAPGM